MIGTSPAILLILFCSALIGCGGASATGDPNSVAVDSVVDPVQTASPQTPEIENRATIVEIWSERDGSVPIRGTSLHFRMYDDATIEFDHVVRKENKRARPPMMFSIRRTPQTKISEEEFRRIKAASDVLLENLKLKPEYRRVGLTLDILDKMTIEVRGGGAARKIVVNNSDYYVLDSRFAKVFPGELVGLLREVRSLLDAKTEEITGCMRTTPNGSDLDCPEVDPDT